MWNLKNDAIELTYKTEADSATEDRIVLAKGKGVGGGWSRSLGLEMQTAVYTTDRQQFLLPSAGSCTQGPVINRNEENTRKNVCVCVCVRVCCCCCSVPRSCPALCDPMDCSMPGFPVLHHLPLLAQTHVHRVGDAIQPSHPLSPPSPPALNLSQHQGLFQ